VGELFMTGFPGRSLDGDTERFLHATHAGGVILFAENLGSPEQVWNLTRRLKRAVSGNLLIGIDQEGGRVQRLKTPFTVFPPMANVGLTGSTEVARRVGSILAAELGAVGINLDFAPVLDLQPVVEAPYGALRSGGQAAPRTPRDTVIGDRAFSEDPRQAAALALALADGLWQGGVCPCGKHFPGHGATLTDSHLDLPRVDLDLASLRHSHLHPFVEAVRAKMPMMMMAHVLIPAGDASLPASLSPFWVDTVLRGELRYEGVVVTDELGMGGVAKGRDIEDIVLALLKTSTDLFLIRKPETCARAVDTVHRALEAGWVKEERIRASATRVRALKKALAGRTEQAATREELGLYVGDASDREFAESLRF
jgi:beta-N-acetylhexosaminidase